MSFQKIKIVLDHVSKVKITRGEVFNFVKTGEDSELVNYKKEGSIHYITGGLKNTGISKHNQINGIVAGGDIVINNVNGSSYINGISYNGSTSSAVKVDIKLEITVPPECDVSICSEGKGNYMVDMDNKDVLSIVENGIGTFLIEKSIIDEFDMLGSGHINVDNGTITSDIVSKGTGKIEIDGTELLGDIRASGTGDILLANVNFDSDVRNSGTGNISFEGTNNISIGLLQNSGTGDIKIKCPVSDIKEIKNSGTGDIKINQLEKFTDLKSSGTGDIKIKNCAKPGNVKNSGVGDISIPGIKSKGFSFGF